MVGAVVTWPPLPAEPGIVEEPEFDAVVPVVPFVVVGCWSAVSTVLDESGIDVTTDAGDLDLLGEAAGGGTYPALLAHSEERDVLGSRCRFVDLETLIRLKRAAGRPKDIERIAELEALRAERDANR